jgi:hypothetical protein
MTRPNDKHILTSMHGRVYGLTEDGQLMCPQGFVSGNGLTPGAGITAGVGTVYRSSILKNDGVIKTKIYIDLTGLASSTTDLDIIGTGAEVAYLGRITTALNGEIYAGRMSCIEVPVGGADDVDLYAAPEGTGVFNGIITDLTQTALVTSGGAWTRLPKLCSALPAADAYLYLTGGEAGTAAAYTAGKFLIEFEGHEVF